MFAIYIQVICTHAGGFVLCEASLQMLTDLYQTSICASALKQYEQYRSTIFIELQACALLASWSILFL